MMWMYRYTWTKILVKYYLSKMMKKEKKEKSNKYVLEWAKNKFDCSKNTASDFLVLEGKL